MKKILISLACVASMASIANADMARIEMGIGGWNATSSGGASYTDTRTLSLVNGTYKSNENDSNNMYAWMLIKHPIPVLPNLRLEYANMEDDGLVSGEFKDFASSAPVDTPATLEMTQFDIIPYYNILDNTAWLTLDLGLDIKIQETKYSVSTKSVHGVAYEGYNDNATLVLPMLYGRLRMEVPATGIALETDVKYVTYDGSTVYDARVKVDYTFDLGMFVDPALELGYRVQKFDIDYEDGSDHTTSDLKFAGIYAGLMLRF